ncbi:MAG TPA: hypothetical protein VIY86_12120, partial [Pirellulaceae bacterium]
MDWNVYGIGIVVAVVGIYLLDVWANRLNLSHLTSHVPTALQDVFDPEAYAKSQAYTRAQTQFGMVSDTYSLLVLLGFWWSGGFGWLDGIVHDASNSSLVRGLLFVGLLFLGTTLLQLPLSWYHTFVLEQRFQFNRTSPRTFVLDRVKELLLTVLLMAPLLL